MRNHTSPLLNGDAFYIGGEWVTLSSDARIDVIDPATEQLFYSVPEAMAADIDHAVTAARHAFDHGPWRKLTHAERATYLRAIALEMQNHTAALSEIWPRESGVLSAGLNASVFTNDVERARAVAGELRSGTVAHNHFAADMMGSFGGFKQSGIGREGGKEEMLAYLETKSVILQGTLKRYP